MHIESFYENLNYNNDCIETSLIVESPFSKEIRILLKQGQVIKKHKSPFPLIIHVLEGSIDFGAHGKTSVLERGSIVPLKGNVTHDLSAKQDSVIRLSLSKLDKIERVEMIARGEK